MSWELAFAPLVPIWLLATLGGAILVLSAVSLWRRGPGAILRFLALAFVLLGLANPQALSEDRDPLPDVAVLAIDKSQSNRIAGRTDSTQAITDDLKARLAAMPDLDLRTVEVTDSNSLTDTDTSAGTRLFTAVEQAIADVPPERLAGVIAVTDGQVHDSAPRSLLEAGAPFHAVLTGPEGEADRKLTVEQAPRFGIVGEGVELVVRVDDLGVPNEGGFATLNISIDGEKHQTVNVPLGQPHPIPLEIRHGGENVIEIETEPGPTELTLQNNRAVVITNGVRDRLRVLLVSGEPHAGERTWRNLLKADPAVDLIHFTILRPPEKQDGTPITELSLIAFPTRELFSLKLNEFDLVIFDRYKRRGVLPLSYLQNVADYVDLGGALLTAAGPDFASPFSLFRTPLAGVLPASPTGEIYQRGYHPRVTQAGHRHPVTAALPGAEQDPPAWGRWFRLIDAEVHGGMPLMEGPDERPLMILDRVGEGRVAQLLSDHAWLWTRGYEGGGPQAELLRRLAHWLMKEPDLDEEKLHASASGGGLTITRRTMGDTVDPVEVTFPDDRTETVTLEASAPGLFTARLPIDDMGLYRLTDGTESTVTAAGPLNPREFADVRSTGEHIKEAADATGGGIIRAVAEDGEVTTPRLRRIRPGRTASGDSWLGLNANERYAVRSVSEFPLMRPELALLLALGGFMLAWRREGR